MGQGVRRNPEAPAVDAEAGVREPIGRYIAQQRRLRGIDLEDLAARTRIPRRSLERLEAGAFDRSPDGFSRGFVRTVAEAIGLDPDDAVARMLVEPDAARARAPRASRALGAVAVGIAVAGFALGANELVSRVRARMGGVAAAASDLPVRRDFVRELAAQHGVEIAALDPRAAVISPLSAEEKEAIAAAALAAAERSAAAETPQQPGVAPPAPARASADTAQSARAAPPAEVAISSASDVAPGAAPAAAPPASAAGAHAAESPAPRANAAEALIPPPDEPAAAGTATPAPRGELEARSAPSDAEVRD